MGPCVDLGVPVPRWVCSSQCTEIELCNLNLGVPLQRFRATTQRRATNALKSALCDCSPLIASSIAHCWLAASSAPSNDLRCAIHVVRTPFHCHGCASLPHRTGANSHSYSRSQLPPHPNFCKEGSCAVGLQMCDFVRAKWNSGIGGIFSLSPFTPTPPNLIPIPCAPPPPVAPLPVFSVRLHCQRQPVNSTYIVAESRERAIAQHSAQHCAWDGHVHARRPDPKGLRVEALGLPERSEARRR